MPENNTGVGSEKASTSPTRSESDWDILGEESDHKNRREKEFKSKTKEKRKPRKILRQGMKSEPTGEKYALENKKAKHRGNK